MKHFVFLILPFLTLKVMAQEGPVLMMPDEDTTMYVQPSPLSLQPEIDLPKISLSFSKLQFPKFDFKEIHQTQYFDSEFFNSRALFSEQSPLIRQSPFQTGLSPFFYNSKMLSGSVTKINDKITIGGFSYGANSVLSAPFPNKNSRQFDSYGSTLFLQYKVSKKFKIEAGVSVEKNNSPFPP